MMQKIFIRIMTSQGKVPTYHAKVRDIKAFITIMTYGTISLSNFTRCFLVEFHTCHYDCMYHIKRFDIEIYIQCKHWQHLYMHSN